MFVNGQLGQGSRWLEEPRKFGVRTFEMASLELKHLKRPARTGGTGLKSLELKHLK